jgi:tight adherence protein C
MVLPVVLLFAVLVLISTVVGYLLFVRSGTVRERMQAVLEDREIPIQAVTPPKKNSLEWLSQIGKLFPISPEDARNSSRMLVAAGIRDPLAVHIYLGAKLAVCAALVAATLLMRDLVIQHAVLRHLIVVAAAAAGFMIPNLALERMANRRAASLRLGLPDALDLMVVCVEAGLGLDQAMVNVTRQLRRTHPAISDEFNLMNTEMRTGKRRVEALRNLAERTAEDEVRKLVRTLIQADRFGTSIAESLRTHAEFMRTRRRQMAEEKAAKVGVKLVFPIFFFIMPAMMVVAIGPGLLQLIKNLIPMMRNFK